jgi:hypothetical protein
MRFDGPVQLGPEDQGVAPKAPDLADADDPDHSGQNHERPKDAGRHRSAKVDILIRERVGLRRMYIRVCSIW